jgi:hypothetical protein
MRNRLEMQDPLFLAVDCLRVRVPLVTTNAATAAAAAAVTLCYLKRLVSSFYIL